MILYLSSCHIVGNHMSQLICLLTVHSIILFKTFDYVSYPPTGVIVAGPPGSGKSSCIHTLVEALSMSPRGASRGSTGSKGSSSEKTHKLIKINPLVVDEQDLMFGNLNQNNDWVDGIFTNACRKANRVKSNFFLTLH